MAKARRVAVLISGRGSNMQALVGQADGYEVVMVASDKPQAAGIDWARGEGVPTWVWPAPPSRAAFEAELTRALEAQRVGTIALAGYMKLLSSDFVARWRGRIVNIHPSLLPAYRGLDTHARALADGMTRHGCSVHLVTEGMDEGRVLASAELAVDPGESVDSLEARVLALEHQLYPATLRQFVASRA